MSEKNAKNKKSKEEVIEEVKESDKIKKDEGTAPSKKKSDIDYEQLIQDEKDKFLRLFAEFENYKKRTSKERLELLRTAGQEVVSSILPVLDDFDRSLEQLSKLGNDEVLEGVTLIYKKLFETLKSKGLEAVDVCIGTVFDADRHEAVTRIPAPSEDMKNKVVDIVEKGYQLSDKIIRYPKVIVGN